MEQINLLPDLIEKAVVMIFVVFGVGLGPAYAIYIMLKKRDMISGFKDYWKRLILTKDIKITIITLGCLMAYQLMKCLINT